ncbi:Pr6Pr family membrane protein [Corynebacterium durum]|uniref:Pr6Pr family membrane protein n=1 Tax=Corynebacterium durum TaxID=61592 RepID=UPI000348AE3E|nr:Pr6Pr family membrane protein [Corynebacterium durum]
MINQLVRWLGLIMFLLGGSAFILSGINSQIVPFENWPAFTSGPEKLLANYSYFTLWSNLLGALVGLGYFTNFRRISPTLAKVVRIDAALMLTVTGLIYNLILRATASPDEGIELYTNPVFHIIMPILAPLTWILFMFLGDTKSEREITLTTTLLALVIPVVWTIWTVFRGITTGGYYPYGFINADKLGWPVAIRNIAGIYIGFFAAVSLVGGVEKLADGRKR